MKRTYWLYRGNRLITAVRLPEGASDAEVKAHALDLHEICPTTGLRKYQAPFEFANDLHHASVGPEEN